MRLLNINEVADRLGCAPATVTNRRKNGMPFYADKAVKEGGNLRWRDTDLDEYIANLPYA